MALELRKTRPEDLPAVVRLVREFAEYENLLKFCDVTEDALGTAMFGKSAIVEGLVAVENDEIIGYALFYPNFASFRGQRGLYLEDIYISAGHRRSGVGVALLRQVARTAAEQGAARIDFQVLNWNVSAVAFYERLGAIRDDDERHMKFTDRAFQELAGIV
jgi:ribosomal protein S18 acetylase RimI-like enzyme